MGLADRSLSFLHECLCRFSPGLPGGDGVGGLEVRDPAGDRCMRKLRRYEPGLPPGAPLPFRHPCHAELTNPLIPPRHSRLSGTTIPSSNASRSWQITSQPGQRTHRLHGLTECLQVWGGCLRCQGQCSVAGTGLSPQRSPAPLSCFSAGTCPPHLPQHWLEMVVSRFLCFPCSLAMGR